MAAEQDDFISFDFDDEFFDDAPRNGPNGSFQDAAARAVERERNGQGGQEGEYLSMDLLVDLPLPPWVPEGREYSEDLLQMLHEEIDDYVSYMSPSDAEHKMRLLTVSRLRTVVRSVFPNAEMSVFGSFDTKLYLPSSDIDIVLFEDSVGDRDVSWLDNVQSGIRRGGIASKCDTIRNARVPILKYTDGLTGFNVDVSINMESGVESAKIVKLFFEDPTIAEGLKPLLLILKQFLFQRNFNEVFTGGLGSYALLSMIACFLKLHPKLQSRQIRAKDNLGVLLLEFFELYGKGFNTGTVAVHVQPNGEARFIKVKKFQQKNGRRPDNPNVITIYDPQNEDNNISGGSHNYRLIKSEFSTAYTLLVALIGRGYEKTRQSHEDERRHPSSSRRRKRKSLVTTVLGNIINIRRDVLERRDAIQGTFDELEATGVMSDQEFEELVGRLKQLEEEGGGRFPGMPWGKGKGRQREKREAVPPPPVQQQQQQQGKQHGKKRGAPPEEDVVYVSDDTNSDMELESPAEPAAKTQPWNKKQR
ncbi:hypothetical protein HDV00_010695, partial [Rhizophlyctis rosea]